MSTNQIFEQLAADSGKKNKVAILKKNASELLKRVVFLALDPFTQFYIRKIPVYSPSVKPLSDLSVAMDELGFLTSRRVTGHAAIEHLQRILQALSKDDALVIERIIKKDLACGVAAATANEVWPGLVPEYPVMLCAQYEEKLLKKIKFPAIVQPKKDGMRFNAICHEGKIEFRSRNGKLIELLGMLDPHFKLLSMGSSVVFDGELLCKDPISGKLLDRKTGNGILNKANKGTISPAEAKMVCAVIWDKIDYQNFKNSSPSEIPYDLRLTELEHKVLVYMEQIKEPIKVELIKTHVVKDLEEVTELYKEAIKRGEEGVILKDYHEGWNPKRVNHQIKFKQELDCDLLIVGVEEGKPGTKYVGMMGALVGQTSDGVIETGVGSGFSDEQRKEFWENPPIGKIMAITYNARITKKTGGKESLFLAIFQYIRTDKDQADSSEAVKWN